MNLTQLYWTIRQKHAAQGFGDQIYRTVRKRLGHLKHMVHLALIQKMFQLRNQLLRRRPITFDIRQTTLLLSPRGSIAFDIWSGFRIEKTELEFILSTLAPGMTFMDIGANTGVFSIAAAKRLADEGGCQVYAFEPCEDTYRILQENLGLNGLSDISTHQLALSDYQGEAMLQVNIEFRDGLNTLGRPSHPSSRVEDQQVVAVDTLDHFIEEHQILKVDIMKVDVEGAELFVFRGARNLLERPDAPLIMYEGDSRCTAGFNYHPVEIMWLLQDCGYSFYVLDRSTGEIGPRKPEHGYGYSGGRVMLLALKPSHPFFTKVSKTKIDHEDSSH